MKYNPALLTHLERALLEELAQRKRAEKERTQIPLYDNDNDLPFITNKEDSFVFQM